MNSNPQWSAARQHTNKVTHHMSQVIHLLEQVVKEKELSLSVVSKDLKNG